MIKNLSDLVACFYLPPKKTKTKVFEKKIMKITKAAYPHTN